VVLVGLGPLERLDRKGHLGQRGQQAQQFYTVLVIHKE